MSAIGPLKILSISPDIIRRFEPELDGGTLFIFNINSGEILRCDRNAFRFFQLVDERRSLGEICDCFLAEMDDKTPTEIAELVSGIASALLTKRVLEAPSDA